MISEPINPDEPAILPDDYDVFGHDAPPQVDARAPRKAKLNGADKATNRLAPIAFNDVPVITQGRYLIKGVIPAEGLTVIWGPPKSGKSFWAMDALLHVALGWEYRGAKVTQGPVVYVAAEGGSSFGARLQAFRLHHRLGADAAPPFYVIPARLSVPSEHENLVMAIRAALGDVVPVAVAIDTLNRTYGGGDENSAKDMAVYIAAADRIREALGCAVVLVHHCGIDGSRPRGSTALTGAVDAQIKISRDHAGFIHAEVEWMKDGPEDFASTNRLENVEVGTDEDGDPVTSCVVVDAEGEALATNAARQKMTNKQSRALDCLHNCLVDQGRPAPEGTHYPAGAQVVPKDQWREYLFSSGVLDKDAANPRADFSRLCGQLSARNIIREWDGRLWLCEKESNPFPLRV